MPRGRFIKWGAQDSVKAALSPENSPAVSAPPGNPRFPLLDSARAAALLMVIAVHAIDEGHPPAGGGRGIITFALTHSVQLFFAVSGFLLFRPYVAAMAAGRPGPRLGSYLQRRVLRIVPAYWAGLTLLAVLLGSRYVPGVFSSHWWQIYGFGQVYSASTQGLGIDSAWTLCVEVSFYLALPAIAWLSVFLARRVGWRVGSLVPVVAMLSIGFGTRFLEAAQLLTWRLSLTLVGMSHFLALGMGLAVLSVDGSRRRRPWRVLALLRDHPVLAITVAVIAGLASGWLILPGTEVALTDGGRDRVRDGALFVLSDFLICASVLLAMVPAIFADTKRDPVRRIMAWQPLQFIGVISYGAYIWHWPLIAWLAGPDSRTFRFTSSTLLYSSKLTLFATAVPVSLAAGALSYYVIELPFLRLKSGWRASKGRRDPHPSRLEAADGNARA